MLTFISQFAIIKLVEKTRTLTNSKFINNMFLCKITLKQVDGNYEILNKFFKNTNLNIEFEKEGDEFVAEIYHFYDEREEVDNEVDKIKLGVEERYGRSIIYTIERKRIS